MSLLSLGKNFNELSLKIHFYVESLNEIYVSSLKIKAPLTGRTFLNLKNYVGSHACMALQLPSPCIIVIRHL